MDLYSKKLLKKFGSRIRAIRHEKGWTLEDCEEHGYPSWEHLRKVEAGKKNISLITINRLSKVFKIPISDLFKDI